MDYGVSWNKVVDKIADLEKKVEFEGEIGRMLSSKLAELEKRMHMYIINPPYVIQAHPRYPMTPWQAYTDAIDVVRRLMIEPMTTGLPEKQKEGAYALSEDIIRALIARREEKCGEGK